MVSGMRTGYPRGLNKGLSSKFRDGSDYDKKVPDYDTKVPGFEKKVPESEKKYPKKAGGHISRNIVQITIKMRTIVRIIRIILFIMSFFLIASDLK